MSEQELKAFKETLKPIFRNYRKMDASMEKKLKKLGFEIIRSKKHYIATYSLCGKNIQMKISKTPSDFKTGINMVRDISNHIRASGLVY